MSFSLSFAFKAKSFPALDILMKKMVLEKCLTTCTSVWGIIHCTSQCHTQYITSKKFNFVERGRRQLKKNCTLGRDNGECVKFRICSTYYIPHASLDVFYDVEAVQVHFLFFLFVVQRNIFNWC